MYYLLRKVFSPFVRLRTIHRVLFILTGILCSVAGYSQSRPNIVVILADDLGYGDVQCYNPSAGKIPTPNIDLLANEGMRFTDAHTSSAICSPSRYTLLTGRYHWRSRLQKGIVDMWERPLITPDRLTIGGLVKRAGYTTAVVGKWHLGWDWPIDSADRKHFTNIGPFEGIYRNPNAPKRTEATDEDRAAWARTFARTINGGPTELGFDSYFGTDVPNWPPFCFIENNKTAGIPTELLQPGQVSVNQASFQGPALEHWSLEDILPALAARADSFITANGKNKQPFLLYFPLTSPHTPLAVNEEWKNKSGLNNEYADFVMETDAAVGRILKAIDESGAGENTIVIFTSDNGCGSYVGAKELLAQGHSVSGPLRGYKGDIWEGGHRVPFIVRYPGVTKPGTECDQPISLADVMATIADITNEKLPVNSGEDSYSILPLLKGSQKQVRRNIVSTKWDGLQSVREGSWKLICSEQPQLYNLATDIAETKDVAAGNPKVVARIMAAREKMIKNGRSTRGARQKNDVEVIRIPRK